MKGFNGFNGFKGFERAGGLDLPADALFADGFEDGLTAWTNNSGSWAVDTAEVKHGSQSVSVDIQDTSIHDIQKTLGTDYTDVWFSFYFRMDDSFALGAFEEFPFIVFYDMSTTYIGQIDLSKGNPQHRFRIRLTGESYQQINIDAPGVSDWIWVKIHYNSTASGEFTTYIDGVQQATTTGDFSGKPDFGEFRLRVSNVDAGTSGKIYIDNVVISESDHGEPPY